MLLIEVWLPTGRLPWLALQRFVKRFLYKISSKSNRTFTLISNHRSGTWHTHKVLSIIITQTPPSVHTHTHWTSVTSCLVQWSAEWRWPDWTGFVSFRMWTLCWTRARRVVIAVQHGAAILSLKQQFCLYDLSAGVSAFRQDDTGRHWLMSPADRATPVLSCLSVSQAVEIRCRQFPTDSIRLIILRKRPYMTSSDQALL